MSSLKIYASGKRVVVWDGLAHWQPNSGQFLLNFDTKQTLKPARLKAPRLSGVRGMKQGAHIRRLSDYSRRLWRRISIWVYSIITPGGLMKPRPATAVRCSLGQSPHSRISTWRWCWKIEQIKRCPGRLCGGTEAGSRFS